MSVTVLTPKTYTNVDIDNIVTGNSVNVFSYMPSTVQSDILAGAATYDVTSYLALAHAAAGVGGKVFYPPGTYPCSKVPYYDAQSIYGAGPTSTILTKAGLLGSEPNSILAPYNYLHDVQLQLRGGNLIRDIGFVADATSTGGAAILDFANRGRIENCTITAKPGGPFAGIHIATNTISGLPITNNNNVAGTHLLNNTIVGCSLGGILAQSTIIASIIANVSITLNRKTYGTGGAFTYTDSSTGGTFSGISSGGLVILVPNTSGLHVGDQITGGDTVNDQVTDLYMTMNIVQNCGSLDGVVASIDSGALGGWIIIHNKLEHSPGGLINGYGAQSCLIANNLFDWQCNNPTNGTNVCLNLGCSNGQGRNTVVGNQFKGNNFFDKTKTAVFVNFYPTFSGGVICAPNLCSSNTFNFASNPTNLTCFNVNTPTVVLGVATGNSYDNLITAAQRGNGDAVWAQPVTVPVQSGITAHAGGGQANAVLLAWGMNEVSVCATNSDSVLLPPALGTGKAVEVGNDGAATLAVFPSTGDLINTAAANASVTLGTAIGKMFRDYAVGKWRSVP